MKDLFFPLVEHAIGQLAGSEVLLARFAGESTDFVRFNHAQVRQPMTVQQAALTLSLINGRRRDNVTLTLTGTPAQDRAAVSDAVRALRSELASLPEDPYLLYCTEPLVSDRETRGALPAPQAAIDDIVSAAGGLDLVGLLASGPIHRGFASSVGARHWHSVEAFLFDWSLYQPNADGALDRALKCAWAGSSWSRAGLQQRIDAARVQLPHLARAARTLQPGEVRAYLAPAALDELLWMLNWDGVSAKAQRTKQSCIQQLADGEARLSPLVSLADDLAGGLAPAFDDAGFARPARVPIVAAGAHAGSMISARTAQEYGLAANGADEEEGMASMALAGGALADDDVLAALDTGLYVGNLHYLNFSDRTHGRVTGMTRFGSFWVERGRIVAPVKVMRWDDTLYRMLGSSLEALTRTPEWILDNRTYGQRSVNTSRIPGALLSRFALTL